MADMQEDDDNIIIAASMLDNSLAAAVGANDANSPTASQLLGSWIFTAAVGIWGLFRAFHVQISENLHILKSFY